MEKIIHKFDLEKHRHEVIEVSDEHGPRLSMRIGSMAIVAALQKQRSLDEEQYGAASGVTQKDRMRAALIEARELIITMGRCDAWTAKERERVLDLIRDAL